MRLGEMGRGSLKNKLNRRERLLGLLRSDDFWTTLRLCRNLQVSHRTLMRDLEELRMQGFPLEASRGRGGGVRLSGRWGIERLGLSNTEAISLLVSLVIAETITSDFITVNSRELRQKITSAFSHSQRQHINELRGRILTGSAASAQVLASYKKPVPAVMKILAQGFFDSKKLRIKYRSESSGSTLRDVEPQFLLLNWPVWYLLAWDELRQDARVFRIDRIISAQLLRESMKRRSKTRFIEAFEKYFVPL